VSIVAIGGNERPLAAVEHVSRTNKINISIETDDGNNGFIIGEE